MKSMAPVVIVGSLILGFRILRIVYGQRESGLCFIYIYIYMCVCVFIYIYIYIYIYIVCISLSI